MGWPSLNLSIHVIKLLTIEQNLSLVRKPFVPIIELECIEQVHQSEKNVGH